MNFDSYTDRVVGVAAALVNALTPGEPGAGRWTPTRGAGPSGARLSWAGRSAPRRRPSWPGSPAGCGRSSWPPRTARPTGSPSWSTRCWRTTGRRRQLSRHDGEPWHLHFTSAAGTEWGAGCATGLAVVVDSQATGRLGVCRAEGCDRVYVDVSRNASRRFCSESCLNRTKVAAFRARARAATWQRQNRCHSRPPPVRRGGRR